LWAGRGGLPTRQLGENFFGAGKAGNGGSFDSCDESGGIQD